MPADCTFVVDLVQAIARIFRYSQKRETYIYRLLYKATAEHRIYRRNVDKEGLFQRVVDKKSIKGNELVPLIVVFCHGDKVMLDRFLASTCFLHKACARPRHPWSCLQV